MDAIDWILSARWHDSWNASVNDEHLKLWNITNAIFFSYNFIAFFLHKCNRLFVEYESKEQ